MIFRFMQQHQAEFPISVMCDVLSVYRSGYYAWLKKPAPKRQQANAKLREKTRTVHQDSGGVLRQPPAFIRHSKTGGILQRKSCCRLIGGDGLQEKMKHRFKATTDSKHNLPVAPNLLNRDFLPEEPNQVYAGGITYIWTTEGWLYLAVVIDLFSRSVVGWAMDKRMTRQLVMP